MASFFSSIPKFILGPLIIILGILYFVYDDPPRTVCDLQNEIFFKENEKYLYPYKRKAIRMTPEYAKELLACQENNSPGACFDWLQGIHRVLRASRNIPDECGIEKQGFLRKFKQMTGGEDQLTPFKNWMTQSLFTFSQISWNSSENVRRDLFNWLDREDQILYCKIKSEYTRLYGKEAYTALQNSLLAQLMKLKNLDAKKTWERTILSHSCRF